MCLRESRWCNYIIIACCILILVPIFMISEYARPAADDYTYATLTHDAIANHGSVFDLLAAAWAIVSNFYNSWQGTYSSAFIMSLQPGIWGPQYYMLTPLLVLGYSFFCLFLTVHYINKWFLQKSQSFCVSVSLLILTILFLWLPSPSQGLFWYNGAMHYVPWFFSTVLNIALLLESGFTTSNRRRFILLAVSAVLSFVISGGNQVTAFANILLMIALFLFHPAKRRRDMLIPLIVAMIGFLLMFLAPGNTVRQSEYESKSVIVTVIRVLYHTIPQFSEWLSFNWFFSLIILTPFVLDIATKNQYFVSGWKLLLVFLISFAVLCGMFCVIYMPTGTFGEDRLTNVIWFAFMIFSWINYAFLVIYLYSHKYILIKSAGHPVIWTVLTVFCLFVLFAGTCGDARSSSYTACTEILSGEAQLFAQEWDERYAILEDDSIKEVEFTPLTATQSMLFLSEFSTDSSHWLNDAVAGYFDKETVTLIE